MNLNTQKEDFSYAYIYAVSSSIGYSLQTATRRLDDSGIDATITVPGKINSKRLPRFDIQIKSTSQDILKNESIKYRLTAKNYDELRENDPFIPQLLVVVLIPKNANDWLSQTEDSLCLKRCAYWLSLRGRPPLEEQTTITIEIPRQNICAS
ncbi:hypothetical protein DSM106972_092670 [Dulcicalothrix desertica PCC 7102]|uniref:DUF4365 domain-containing protein n=1 Tax=Dulcicalothrix desertica PCC 7102 TaxID=232991 RepID=A0A3S1C051_9CYAN|nr:DUF4365 domain-containing protein [Dulcicalothrix desertica]RUS94630.1 hypothetical protein DSM106972_092670 [Dulcicalothrix desertica PCC 7102]TWH62522.1 uncharacterized protein DUF4365 [Dulcicalothrix desertica PCC 7102]